MNFLKNIIKALYEKFIPQTERATEALTVLTPEQKNGLVVSYLRKDAPLLDRKTPEYSQVITVVKDVLTLHYNAPSFERLCQSYVRSVVPPSYYVITAISNLLAAHFSSEPSSNPPRLYNENDLLNDLGPVLVEAQGVNNPIKRRALIRAAIKEQLPTLPSDKTALLIELVLAV